MHWRENKKFNLFREKTLPAIEREVIEQAGNSILRGITDLEQFIKGKKLVMPKLDVENIIDQFDDKTVQLSRRDPYYRGQNVVVAYATWKIPFSGDSDIFKVMCQTFPISADGEIEIINRKSYLVIQYKFGLPKARLNERELKEAQSELQKCVKYINDSLESLKESLNESNARIESAIRTMQEVKERKDREEQHRRDLLKPNF